MNDSDEQGTTESDIAPIAAAASAPSIWSAPKVTQRPSEQTRCWTVRELPNGNRHLCAWLGYEGRVSSAISDWRPDERVIVTSSGRRYNIDSPVGVHPDAEHVWRYWCPVQGFDPADYVDVSREYLDIL